MTWDDFKYGNKMIWRDIKDWAKGDLWPWLEGLATLLLFIAIIIIQEVNALSLSICAIWLGFMIFATVRTIILEGQKD